MSLDQAIGLAIAIAALVYAAYRIHKMNKEDMSEELK